MRKLVLGCALLCAVPAAAQSASGSASAPLLVTATVVPSCEISVDADAAARVQVYCGQASRLRVRRGARGPLELAVVEKGRHATARFTFPIGNSRPAMRREQGTSPARPSDDLLIVLEF